MLKKRLTPPEMTKAVVLCLLIVVIGTVSLSSLQSETDAENPIAEAEKLLLSEKYYEAILALEPLLISDKKSEAQEQALWLAHQLAKKCVPVMQKEYGYSETLFEVKTSEKTRLLDQMVGGNFWDFAIYYYDYGYGFLQRLIDEYPNTPKRPIAEYYLIRKGAVVLGADAETIQAYHAYIQTYEKTGRAEVYMVYRDLAHIHHGIWAALTFPEESDAGLYGFGHDGFYSFQDPEKQKATAAAHKAKAETYYLKYHLNPYGLPADKSFQRLKNNEAFGWEFILYGC